MLVILHRVNHMKKHTEIRFEEEIERSLTEYGGYTKGNEKSYDKSAALFPDDVIEFIKLSQAKRWKSIEEYYGSNAERAFTEALVKDLDARGSLDVLRSGFRFFGKDFPMAYFMPNSSLNPQAAEQYQNNILRVYRQLHFEQKEKYTSKSLDIVLALNGIPIVTMELKNPGTSQTVEHAKRQYKEDRDPKLTLFAFNKRTLVHFAVDTEEVAMTTKLDGDKTVFLPFNKGNGLGSGNPVAEGDYRTGYLWEEVLTKESILDIIARFLHLSKSRTRAQGGKTGSGVKREYLIFPRYHQLDAVRKLIKSAKEKGPGHNYLIQHSAGSGKSNSIAWLAYRLASLHNTEDVKSFHSVIVITDRRVLDQQLQDTIYQFEHKQGMVQKIDDDTRQLVGALAKGVPIIVTTLQKFPFVLETIEKMNEERKTKGSSTEIILDTTDKRFAVIVDEAHSSQSGEAASELKRILNKEGIEKTVLSQLLEEDDDDITLDEDEKKELMKQAAMRGKQPNISFFAFTATPKFKTKAVFDEPGENGSVPFHLYSMRQAIEEGFILDVLQNYTTYKRFYKIAKTIEDDPQVSKSKGKTALARFVNLHPHNLRQKTEIIVEHFRQVTRHKIGGRAKAMIVTASRLHAVRYKLIIDQYIKEMNYTDIKALVAFSGTVIDEEQAGKEYRETVMNGGIKESELPERFASEEYQVLIVAEKYQTGFDQPLLHTMYVDKRLDGIHAVQTLSRLNRTAPGKTDTFVLDFVNEAEEILAAFKPYYERTEYAEDPEPQALSNLEHEIYQWQLFDFSTVQEYAKVWFQTAPEKRKSEHKKLNSLLDPVVENFAEIPDEVEREDKKKKLVGFKNLYMYFAQIVPYPDSKREMLYVFIRNLLHKLPKRQTMSIEVDDKVELEYYRITKLAENIMDYNSIEQEPVKGPLDVGTGREEEVVQLSLLINKLNEAFGTEFTPADQYFFDQIVQSAVEDEELRVVANANSLENFRTVFDRMILTLFVERMGNNQDIYNRLMNDPEFKHLATTHLGEQVYKTIVGEG